MKAQGFQSIPNAPPQQKLVAAAQSWVQSVTSHSPYLISWHIVLPLLNTQYHFKEALGLSVECLIQGALYQLLSRQEETEVESTLSLPRIL